MRMREGRKARLFQNKKDSCCFQRGLMCRCNPKTIEIMRLKIINMYKSTAFQLVGTIINLS